MRADYGAVWAAEGNRGSTTVYYAKQPEKLIRSELGEAN